MKVNINSDVGESFGRYVLGRDEELIPLIASASIACGMHAGDPMTMSKTVGLAVSNGVSVGAHPGFDDRWGFGRRRIDMNLAELECLVSYQIGALQALAHAAGTSVTHVKPHGALNNMAVEDAAYARAIARAVRGAGQDLTFVANTGSAMVEAGREQGLRVAREFYADRNYGADGNILGRSNPEAMIRNPEVAAANVLRAVREGYAVSACGREFSVEVDTICVHGDEPDTIEIVRVMRDALTAAGCEIVPLTEMDL